MKETSKKMSKSEMGEYIKGYMLFTSYLQNRTKKKEGTTVAPPQRHRISEWKKTKLL